MFWAIVCNSSVKDSLSGRPFSLLAVRLYAAHATVCPACKFLEDSSVAALRDFYWVLPVSTCCQSHAMLSVQIAILLLLPCLCQPCKVDPIAWRSCLSRRQCVTACDCQQAWLKTRSASELSTATHVSPDVRAYLLLSLQAWLTQWPACQFVSVQMSVCDRV